MARDQPNQCFMNIFGSHYTPYDESHHGKRYNLKNPIEDAIFPLHCEHLQLT